MRSKTAQYEDNGMWLVWLLAAIIIISCAAVSWGLTCLLVWAICSCLGFPFDLLQATGIWLIIMLIEHIAGAFRKDTE